MRVEELRRREKREVRRQERRVREMRREGCAEEDGDDIDGGRREREGEDEGEACGLHRLSVSCGFPVVSRWQYVR